MGRARKAGEQVQIVALTMRSFRVRKTSDRALSVAWEDQAVLLAAVIIAAGRLRAARTRHPGCSMPSERIRKRRLQLPQWRRNRPHTCRHAMSHSIVRRVVDRKLGLPDKMARRGLLSPEPGVLSSLSPLPAQSKVSRRRAMSSVHQLIYVSAARAQFAANGLDSILTSARQNNQLLGVTGLLLFHDGSFFQVLEGAQQAVAYIFMKIQKDPRHTGVIVMQSSDVVARAFPNWSMGYMNAHALRPEEKTALIDLRSLSLAGTNSLSASPAIRTHVDTFLASFREFAEI